MQRASLQGRRLFAMLEDECGFPLFARQGNRLMPTAEGELLYAEVQRMMHSRKNRT